MFLYTIQEIYTTANLQQKMLTTALLLLQQCGLYLLTCVIQNFDILRLVIFMMKVRATCTWSMCWN